MSAVPSALGVDPEQLRLAARGCATGVAVLTTHCRGEVFAKTVSSYATLSMTPPLVSVAVTADSPLVAAARDTGCFALNVLGAGQEEISRRFATPGAGRTRGSFAGVEARSEITGSPVLTGCPTWFDCRLHSVLPGGDHSVLVGLVVAVVSDGGDPLLYHDGRYATLARFPQRPDRAPTASGVRP